MQKYTYPLPMRLLFGGMGCFFLAMTLVTGLSALVVGGNQAWPLLAGALVGLFFGLLGAQAWYALLPTVFLEPDGIAVRRFWVTQRLRYVDVTSVEDDPQHGRLLICSPDNRLVIEHQLREYKDFTLRLAQALPRLSHEPPHWPLTVSTTWTMRIFSWCLAFGGLIALGHSLITRAGWEAILASVVFLGIGLGLIFWLVPLRYEFEHDGLTLVHPFHCRVYPWSELVSASVSSSTLSDPSGQLHLRFRRQKITIEGRLVNYPPARLLYVLTKEMPKRS
jgi:hypothetical protein